MLGVEEIPYLQPHKVQYHPIFLWDFQGKSLKNIPTKLTKKQVAIRKCRVFFKLNLNFTLLIFYDYLNSILWRGWKNCLFLIILIINDTSNSAAYGFFFVFSLEIHISSHHIQHIMRQEKIEQSLNIVEIYKRIFYSVILYHCEPFKYSNFPKNSRRFLLQIQIKGIT